jgi:hypothetical protein
MVSQKEKLDSALPGNHFGQTEINRFVKYYFKLIEYSFSDKIDIFREIVADIGYDIPI